jgi:hypothetical protein
MYHIRRETVTHEGQRPTMAKTSLTYLGGETSFIPD